MNLGKRFTSVYWFVMKDTTQEQPNGRDVQDRVLGVGEHAELLCLLWVHHPAPQHLDAVTNLEVL